MQDNYLDVKKALLYLKANHKLYMIFKNEKIFVTYINLKVIISSNCSTIRINPYEFETVYKDAKFYLLDNEEEEVDITKDKEYYSWRQ